MGEEFAGAVDFLDVLGCPVDPVDIAVSVYGDRHDVVEQMWRADFEEEIAGSREGRVRDSQAGEYPQDKGEDWV